MKKAIIYYRKSTDRDDKQANSLEHQLGNCRRIAQVNNFDVIEEIGESKSAKIEGTREGFNRLIRLCKSSKIDYIIIDEPKRLSRNNLDSARVIDLFDKKLIRGIYSTGRLYLADQINDIFLLQLDLSLSKMDNAHRSKDVKDKMTTCINNTGRFLRKAPFGYKNITIKKGHKDIIVDEKEAKIVKEIFDLRLEKKAFTTIANILKTKYGGKINLNCQANTIHRLIHNTFYYGVFKRNGKTIIGSHKPIISKSTYDNANGVGKGVHEKIQTINKNIGNQRPYYFKGLLKDSIGIKLTGYEKKGHIYYSSQSRSSTSVSIGEDLLFHKLGVALKELDVTDMNNGESIEKNIALELLKISEQKSSNEMIEIDKQIAVIKNKQDKLLDMKLDELIDEKTYLVKYNLFENQIKALFEQKTLLKNDKFLAKTQIMFELLKSLYQSYITLNKEGKIYIIKKLVFELSVNNKKELQVAETPLLECSKLIKIAFGIPKKFDIRTFTKNLSMINLEDLKGFRNFLKNISK